MSNSLQDSVVLITSSKADNNSFGTGFVIHRDEQGTYVLTCAHVVSATDGEGFVKVDNAPATVIAVGSADDADVAVLRVAGLSNKPLLRLCMGSETNKSFEIAGYRHLNDNPKKPLVFKRLYGVFGESVETGMTPDTLIRVWEIEITSNDELRPGNSGSPVVDKSNCAIGIVSTRQNEMKKRGWAIPVEILKKVWLTMPPGLFEPAPSSVIEKTVEIQERGVAEGPGNPLMQTVKKQVLLDRRLVTEIVALFYAFSEQKRIDPRTLCLLQFGSGLFDQLIVEQDYGSALANIIDREKEILGSAVVFYQPPEKQHAKDTTIEEIEDAGDLWMENPQFRLAVSQYDRSKGSSTGNIAANVSYLQHTLQLARELDAAIIPHPDRWFLYRWWFEHCIWATKSSLPRTVSPIDQKELFAASLHMPESRREALTMLSSRFPDVPGESVALIRYGPIPYPFPTKLLDHYDLEHLEHLSPFLYEFCIPASTLSPSGGI